MQPVDIMIDVMRRYGRPIHEQELVCQLALRSDMRPAQMYHSAEKMRSDLQQLAKFGYIQQLGMKCYTILPLSKKEPPLQNLERLDYVRLSRAYMEAMMQQSADKTSDELNECPDERLVPSFTAQESVEDMPSTSIAAKKRKQTKNNGTKSKPKRIPRPIRRQAKRGRPLAKAPKNIGRRIIHNKVMRNNIKAPPELRFKRKVKSSAIPSTSNQTEGKQLDNGKQKKSN